MASKKVSQKYYAVLRGRKLGIFLSWEECQEQIQGFSHAKFKSFQTKVEAETALGIYLKASLFPDNLISYSDKIITNSICVDASCLGNPGIVEYKGVNTNTHEVIFHSGQIPYGTNNLGEFLALVHGLAYLAKQGENIPIYSDSITAIKWVQARNVRTKLKRDASSEKIFNLVDRALNWLENNDSYNPIIKWSTDVWGEIPADFGRKKFLGQND
jgi:ribonuclease HI